MIYLTYNDQPSGIYFSQVTDVCKYVNKTYNCSIRLVAFISIRNFSENKKKIKSHSPSAIVLPMFPQLKNWRLNKFTLQILFLFIGKQSVWARGVFAVNLALDLKKNKTVYSVVFDGRGAYEAEFKEYLLKIVELKDDIGNLEEIAVNQSDYRLAVSSKLVEYWQENYKYTADKHVVIPCTINSFNQEESKVNEVERLRTKFGYSNEDIIFVFSGSSADWHSLELMDDFILLQMQRNATIKLLLLMNVSVENLHVFKKFPDRIIQKWVTPIEVNQYLSLADYGILLREPTTTNKVASPTKFAEYLNAGLKVIISKEIGDFSDFVKKHNCGIVVDEASASYEWRRISSSEKTDLTELSRTFFSKQSYKKHYESIIQVLKN